MFWGDLNVDDQKILLSTRENGRRLGMYELWPWLHDLQYHGKLTISF